MSIEINELQINLLTNIPGKNKLTFSKEILYHPDMDKPSINKFPYLVSNIELPKNGFDGYPYDKLVNIFFNRNVLLNEVKKLYNKGSSEDYKQELTTESDEIMEIEKRNVYLIMKLLFPTKYFVVKNYHSSYDYVVPGKTTLDVGFYYNPLKTNFSYIKQGDVYTVTKVTWLNDILNHPSYKELITKTIAFLKTRKQRKAQLIREGADKNNMDKVDQYKKTLFTTKRSDIKDDNLLRDFVSIELAKYIDQGELGNYNTGAVFFPGNSKWQSLLLTKDVENVPFFYEMIENVYERYINTDESVDISDYVKYMQTGVDNINIGKTNEPQKQIYLIVDFIDGEVNEDNKKDVFCPYTDQYLGNLLEDLLFPEKGSNWEVTPAPYIYSVKDQTNKANEIDGDKYDIISSGVDDNVTVNKYENWAPFSTHLFNFDNDNNKDKYSIILQSGNVDNILMNNKVNNKPLLIILKQLSDYIPEPQSKETAVILEDLMRLKSQNEVEIAILKDKINSGNYSSEEIKKLELETVQYLFCNSVINNALNFSSFKKKGGTRKRTKNRNNKTKKVRFNI
jgi:hypothetical protein